MYRSSTSTNAAFAYAYVTAGNLVGFKWRSADGTAANVGVQVSGAAPAWVKLIRTGNIFAGYYSSDGSNWIRVATPQTIAIPSSALVGMAVMPKDAAKISGGGFSGFGLTKKIIVGGAGGG